VCTGHFDLRATFPAYTYTRAPRHQLTIPYPESNIGEIVVSGMGMFRRDD
jgi:hypothetical protein